MYARLVIGDFMMVMAFLSVLETTPTFFEELRTTWAVWEGHDLHKALQALKNKSCCCAAGLAPPLASAISRADTPKFRKRLNTWNVEKLRRNSLVLQFQKIPHQY